ncbi:MAG: ribbon-helix-helix domain-containing protein [Candidatus Nanoarchaeia archaeon]
MKFRKVTISLPENLYKEGMVMVNKGLFSNFSDLVRSGIREEFKELQSVSDDFDERYICSDKELVQGVKQSVKESKAGKGKKFKTDKEMDEYLEAL